MTCHLVQMPAGGSAIVCTTSRRRRCRCGRPAGLLCDWKVSSRKRGTCDAPICDRCAVSPAPDKDLCQDHAREFERWKASRLRDGREVPV